MSGQEEDKDEAGGDTYDDYDDHYFDHEHQYNANFLENHDKTFQCLDKKRIKMKQGETLALNERIMLSLVSTGHGKFHCHRHHHHVHHHGHDHGHHLIFPHFPDCPFIVCMTYAFHTPDKLCFILDLMNGGD